MCFSVEKGGGLEEGGLEILGQMLGQRIFLSVFLVFLTQKFCVKPGMTLLTQNFCVKPRLRPTFQTLVNTEILC